MTHAQLHLEHSVITRLHLKAVNNSESEISLCTKVPMSNMWYPAEECERMQRQDRLPPSGQHGLSVLEPFPARNLGNSCYAITVLQLLRTCDDVLENPRYHQCCVPRREVRTLHMHTLACSANCAKILQ